MKLVVDLNSDVLKTLHSLQAELKSFREVSLNERKEQHAINEALLCNMMGGSLKGKPNQSTNISKREPYHEQASSPREAENEGTPKATKGDHHSPASDDSLSPQRKRQRNDDSLQREYRKVRAPTYEGEVNMREKDEEWLLGVINYF